MQSYSSVAAENWNTLNSRLNCHFILNFKKTSWKICLNTALICQLSFFGVKYPLQDGHVFSQQKIYLQGTFYNCVVWEIAQFDER